MAIKVNVFKSSLLTGLIAYLSGHDARRDACKQRCLVQRPLLRRLRLLYSAAGLAAALSVAGWPGAAHAWSYSEGFITDLGEQLAMQRTQRAFNEANYGTSSGSHGGSTAARSPLDLGNLGVTAKGALSSSLGVDKLAITLYPRDQVVPRRIAITRLIESFHRTAEQAYGVPPNNLATATAVLLAGAWAAYRDEPFPDAWAQPLYRQFAAALEDDPRIAQLSPRSKVYQHQMLVGLGLLMTVEQMELQKHPDAARKAQMQQAGAEVLRAATGKDPARLTMGSRGLRAR